jgi:hypothetical protein
VADTHSGAIAVNLSALADIGSLINGLAVLASLIYLSLEVRHAQRAQRASIHQARVERVTHVSLELARPELAKVLAKAASGATDFSGDEVLQLFYVIRVQVLALDDAFWQSDAGFLDAPSLETTILTMKRMMANPVLRSVWHLVSPQLAHHVSARIEEIVTETPLVAPTDWAVAWKHAYAKLVA